MLRFSSIRRVSASRLVTPTLKSPSVARMTRLMPPLTKFSEAIWYASWIPAPPLVEPPAESALMAFWISPGRSPRVAGSATPLEPA